MPLSRHVPGKFPKLHLLHEQYLQNSACKTGVGAPKLPNMQLHIRFLRIVLECVES